MEWLGAVGLGLGFVGAMSLLWGQVLTNRALRGFLSPRPEALKLGNRFTVAGAILLALGFVAQLASLLPA